MKKVIILGIETSCDDTSVAVLEDQKLLANVISSQMIHNQYGGVIPELASRAHSANIIPTIDAAVKKAGISLQNIDAIAYTLGPGLMGSLLVGTSFAKGLSIGLDIPLIDVNHLQGHLLSHFVQLPDKPYSEPQFPLLVLLVSGGHTQLIVLRSPLEMEIVGSTIDDAAGEAFDKCAKVMGLGYPGGPLVDKLAQQGNHLKFKFARPSVGELDFSFSGLKTSFLYFIRDRVIENPDFIEQNKADLAASLQYTITDILMKRLIKAAKMFDISNIAISGGVSANSALRNAVAEEGRKRGWRVHIPEFVLTTDNAAMIAITGYFKYLISDFSSLEALPYARIKK